MQLLRNSAWNILAFVFNVASNFVTIPFVVKAIGLGAFGRSVLVISLCAPLMMIGTILSQALVSKLTTTAAGSNELNAQPIIDVALRLCVLFALSFCLLFAAIGPYAAGYFSAGHNGGAPMNFEFAALCTGLFARQVTLLLQAVFVARNDFRSVAQMSAFSGVADISCVLILIHANPTSAVYLSGIAPARRRTLLLSLARARQSAPVSRRFDFGLGAIHDHAPEQKA